jgi:hypothetical protein
MKKNMILTETQLKKLITESLEDLKNRLQEPNSNDINDITLFKVFNENQIDEAEEFLKYKVKKYESYYFPIVVIKIEANITYPTNNDDQYNSEDVSVFIPFMYRYKSTMYPDVVVPSKRNPEGKIVKGLTQTYDYGFVSPSHLIGRISKNNIDYNTKVNFFKKLTGDIDAVSRSLNEFIFKEEDKTYEQEIKNKLNNLLSPFKPDNLESKLVVKRSQRFQ